VATPLREIDAPSGPDVYPKFGYTVAYRFHVAKKSSFKPLDPSDHNATNRRVCQMVEPRGELREWPDAEHGHSVIERLHSVKPTWSDCRLREIRSNVSARGRGFLAPNRPVGNTRSWPGLPFRGQFLQLPFGQTQAERPVFEATSSISRPSGDSDCPEPVATKRSALTGMAGEGTGRRACST
jgi:hypothetical protein